MKQTIKPFFPLILTVLCALFGIYTLFQSIGFIGRELTIFSQKNLQTSVAKQLAAQDSLPVPQLQYVGGTLLVGDASPLLSLFSLEFSDGSRKNISEIPSAALYLIDVRSPRDSSILTCLTTDEVDSLEEIPSIAVYDTENQLLYFHQSGVYTLTIRFYFDSRPGILYECQVPVEVR